MITGRTTLIAHLGYPTEAFKAPMIYNPYFEQAGIDAVVVPMGVKPEDYPTFLRSLFRLTNIRGSLVTMPHKVVTASLLDEVTPTVKIIGSSSGAPSAMPSNCMPTSSGSGRRARSSTLTSSAS